MKAVAVFPGTHEVRVIDEPQPQVIRGTEVLLRMRRSASAARTGRSPRSSTANRRRARTTSSSDTRRWARWWRWAQR